MGEEGVFDALLVILLPVVGRIEEQQPERAVGDGRLESVRRENVVEPFGGLLGACLMEFDAVGLDRRRAGLPEQVGQPSERLARAAAGIERADVRLGGVVVAVGRPHQGADHVDDPVRRRIVAALGLCCKSHVNLPSSPCPSS